MPLFYHTGALGDVLLSLPFLRAASRAASEGDWTLVAKEEVAPLVSRLLPYERRAAPGLLEFAPLSRLDTLLDGPGPLGVAACVPVRAEPLGRLAAILDRHGALYGFVRGAAGIEAIARRIRPDVPVVLSEPLAWTTSRGEDIETTLGRALERLEGRKAPLRREDFALSPAELPELPEGADPLAFLGDAPRGRVALLYPGASARERHVPVPLLEEVASRLRGLGWAVAWSRGPVERERGEGLPAAPTLECPDLILLAHVASRVHLWIGADTGPTHLAAAVGTATLCLHGRPNDLWRTRGLRSRVLGGAAGFPSAGATVDAALELTA